MARGASISEFCSESDEEAADDPADDVELALAVLVKKGEGEGGVDERAVVGRVVEAER